MGFEAFLKPFTNSADLKEKGKLSHIDRALKAKAQSPLDLGWRVKIRDLGWII